MKRKVFSYICALFVLLVGSSLSAMDIQHPHELPQEKAVNPWLKGAVLGIAPAVILGYGAEAYWSNGTSLNKFRFDEGEGFFGPSSYSGGADKIGHLYGSFYASRFVGSLLKGLGQSQDSAALWGSGSSFSTYTMIEVLDGFTKAYGAGMWDMVFNFSGAGLSYILQKNKKLDRIFKPSISYYPSEKFLKNGRGFLKFSEDYNNLNFHFDINFTQINVIQNFLVNNNYLNFFGHLPQLSLMFNTHGFKPKLEDRSVNLSLALSIDVLSIIEFIEKRVFYKEFPRIKALASSYKFIPSFIVLDKQWNFTGVRTN